MLQESEKEAKRRKKKKKSKKKKTKKKSKSKKSESSEASEPEVVDVLEDDDDDAASVKKAIDYFNAQRQKSLESDRKLARKEPDSVIIDRILQVKPERQPSVEIVVKPLLPKKPAPALRTESESEELRGRGGHSLRVSRDPSESERSSRRSESRERKYRFVFSQQLRFHFWSDTNGFEAISKNLSCNFKREAH